MNTRVDELDERTSGAGGKVNPPETPRQQDAHVTCMNSWSVYDKDDAGGLQRVYVCAAKVDVELWISHVAGSVHAAWRGVCRVIALV